MSVSGHVTFTCPRGAACAGVWLSPTVRGGGRDPWGSCSRRWGVARAARDEWPTRDLHPGCQGSGAATPRPLTRIISLIATSSTYLRLFLQILLPTGRLTSGVSCQSFPACCAWCSDADVCVRDNVCVDSQLSDCVVTRRVAMTCHGIIDWVVTLLFVPFWRCVYVCEGECDDQRIHLTHSQWLHCW